MSGVDRALGLARSLAVYHLIPWRQRRLRTLYATFARADDLVFDVGAHVGNRTRALLALGCRVVAVEPQPHVADALRAVLGRRVGLVVVQAAVTDRCGRAALAVSERTPTVSTVTADWRERRAHDAGFASVRWNSAVEVDAVTLDALIAIHGEPTFVKLDIEGGELAALTGLTWPIRAVSFEYLREALDGARACVERMEALGAYEFNWAPGESHRFASPEWLDGASLLRALRQAGASGHGDIYARRRG